MNEQRESLTFFAKTAILILSKSKYMDLRAMIVDIYTTGAKICKAMGDPQRARIIDMISCGEICACRIQADLDMAQSTLSHHMRVLCDSGLVTARYEGKWTYYSLDSSVVDSEIQFIRSITEPKDSCICRETDRDEGTCP